MIAYVILIMTYKYTSKQYLQVMQVYVYN